MRAAEQIGLKMSGSTAVIQGFGNVGSMTALEMARRGVKVIGISDHSACLFDRRGLPVEEMARYAAQHGALAGFSSEAAADPTSLLTQQCDFLVPAAVERVIDAPTAARLRCRVLAEAANGPTTPDADTVLNDRRGEIFVIPDILCNAGGVVVSYFEWVQGLQQFFWEENEVTQRLTQVLDRSFEKVISRVKRDDVPMRTAAMAIGVEKVYAVEQMRGLFP